jgi:hypothetical protein
MSVIKEIFKSLFEMYLPHPVKYAKKRWEEKTVQNQTKNSN